MRSPLLKASDYHRHRRRVRPFLPLRVSAWIATLGLLVSLTPDGSTEQHVDTRSPRKAPEYNNLNANSMEVEYSAGRANAEIDLSEDMDADLDLGCATTEIGRCGV